MVELAIGVLIVIFVVGLSSILAMWISGLAHLRAPISRLKRKIMKQDETPVIQPKDLLRFAEKLKPEQIEGEVIRIIQLGKHKPKEGSVVTGTQGQLVAASNSDAAEAFQAEQAMWYHQRRHAELVAESTELAVERTARMQARLDAMPPRRRGPA